MISREDIQRIQDEIGRLALQAVRIDIDGFREATDAAASPQALAAGLDPRAVTNAAKWAEMASLLKPFRDHVLERLDSIRATLAETDDDLVEEAMACPQCHERRVDELALNDDGTVVCATCGRRYSRRRRADVDARLYWPSARGRLPGCLPRRRTCFSS